MIAKSTYFDQVYEHHDISMANICHHSRGCPHNASCSDGVYQVIETMGKPLRTFVPFIDRIRTWVAERGGAGGA